MGKFRALAAPDGVFVEYERDRAGRDIGLHLTQPSQTGDGKITTPALIWFQMKGVMAGTLNIDEYRAASEVAIDLDVGHLRFWYINIQPTYLAVYVESADQFLAIDITAWVAKNYGQDIMTLDQKTVRVRVDKKNVLDEEFFRRALNQNLVPALRKSFEQDDDARISRFLRDSSVVKWLADAQERGSRARLTVIKWMSKLRTEVYFEVETEDGTWERLRGHWQFMMGDLVTAFPYLVFRPAMKAVESSWSETIEGFDGEFFEDWHHSFTVYDTETDDEIDDEEFDGECLLEIGNGEFSYGEMAGGERIEHNIAVTLNDIGERWAGTLKILVDAEIISVDVEPHMISVAPWHRRNA